MVIEHDGRFQMAVAAEVVETDVLELEFEVGRFAYKVHCPTAELASAAGARVVLDLCDVRIQVSDEAGTPLPETGLMILRRSSEQSDVSWIEDRSLTNGRSLQLDAQGSVDVTLERGLPVLALRADLPDHVPWVQTWSATPCGAVLAVTLRRPTPQDEIRGRVLSPTGAAFGPHWIEAVPVLAELGTPYALLSSHGWADERGEFALPVQQGLTYRLVTSDANLGEAVLEPVTADQSGAELRFPSVQRVLLELNSATGGALRVSDSQSFCRLLLADGRTRQENGTRESILMERVPVGRHGAFVLAGEPALFAWVDLDVVAGYDVRLDVTLQPGHGASGHVVDASGRPLAGVQIRVLDAAWSRFDEHDLFSRRTRPDGSFQIFLGDRSEADLELVCEGRGSARVRVQADSPATWTMP